MARDFSGSHRVWFATTQASTTHGQEMVWVLLLSLAEAGRRRHGWPLSMLCSQECQERAPPRALAVHGSRDAAL